ncbi:MAG: sodium-dependent transporter, partial [Balneolaceae bacterium]
LVFDVLPQMFDSLGGFIGLILGFIFFILLGLAALTSSISLLEVPVSYVIDEFSIRRKTAAWGVGGIVSIIAVIISYDLSLIDLFVAIFNEVGLPLGGLMISLFLGYFWKTERAMLEIQEGNPSFPGSTGGKVWVIFIRYICPVLIAIVLVNTLLIVL